MWWGFLVCLQTPFPGCALFLSLEHKRFALYIHTRMRTHTISHRDHRSMQLTSQGSIHTHIHTRTHTRTHSHTLTHAHTHSQRKFCHIFRLLIGLHTPLAVVLNTQNKHTHLTHPQSCPMLVGHTHTHTHTHTQNSEWQQNIRTRWYQEIRTVVMSMASVHNTRHRHDNDTNFLIPPRITHTADTHHTCTHTQTAEWQLNVSTNPERTTHTTINKKASATYINFTAPNSVVSCATPTPKKRNHTHTNARVRGKLGAYAT